MYDYDKYYRRFDWCEALELLIGGKSSRLGGSVSPAPSNRATDTVLNLVKSLDYMLNSRIKVTISLTLDP